MSMKLLCNMPSLNLFDKSWQRLFCFETILMIPVLTYTWWKVKGPHSLRFMTNYNNSSHGIVDILTNPFFFGIISAHILQGFGQCILSLIVLNRLKHQTLFTFFDGNEFWNLLLFSNIFGLLLGGFITDYIQNQFVMKKRKKKKKKMKKKRKKMSIGMNENLIKTTQPKSTAIPLNLPQRKNTFLSKSLEDNDRKQSIEQRNEPPKNSMAALKKEQKERKEQNLLKNQKRRKRKYTKKRFKATTNLHTIRLCLNRIIMPNSIICLLCIALLYFFWRVI